MAKPGEPRLYRGTIPWHCSAGCGEPIRLGQMCVQTSPGLTPLERAHAACLAGRKGVDHIRLDDGTDVELFDTADAHLQGALDGQA
jgi:hypothetical protein